MRVGSRTTLRKNSSGAAASDEESLDVNTDMAFSSNRANRLAALPETTTGRRPLYGTLNSWLTPTGLSTACGQPTQAEKGGGKRPTRPDMHFANGANDLIRLPPTD